MRHPVSARPRTGRNPHLRRPRTAKGPSARAAGQARPTAPVHALLHPSSPPPPCPRRSTFAASASLAASASARPRPRRARPCASRVRRHAPCPAHSGWPVRCRRTRRRPRRPDAQGGGTLGGLQPDIPAMRRQLGCEWHPPPRTRAGRRHEQHHVLGGQLTCARAASRTRALRRASAPSRPRRGVLCEALRATGACCGMLRRA